MISSFFTTTSVAIIIISIAFIFITHKAWNELIRKGALEIKNKFFNFKTSGQEQVKATSNTNDQEEIKKLFEKIGVKNTNELDKLFDESKKQISERETSIRNLFNLWKLYMFSYLNLFLVLNSKIALLWFYNNPNSTKEMFKMQLYIPTQVLNIEIEREAIFTALISNYLIQKDQRDLYSVTNIGRDFLIFINFIKQ